MTDNIAATEIFEAADVASDTDSVVEPVAAPRSGFNVEQRGPAAVEVTWPRLDGGAVGAAYTVPADMGDLAVTFRGEFSPDGGSDVVTLMGDYGDGVEVKLGSSGTVASWHVPKIDGKAPTTVWPVVEPGTSRINCELICTRPAL